eukprot:1643808-Alexandrium_andersonii.AAC.1
MRWNALRSTAALMLVSFSRKLPARQKAASGPLMSSKRYDFSSSVCVTQARNGGLDLGCVA